MSQRKLMGRRQFMKSGAAGVLGAGLVGSGGASLSVGPAAKTAPSGKIKEYRVLGRTGFKVSDIGFGGADLQEPELFQAAVDAGINYFDVAEHYATVETGAIIKVPLYLEVGTVIKIDTRTRSYVERVR